MTTSTTVGDLNVRTGGKDLPEVLCPSLSLDPPRSEDSDKRRQKRLRECATSQVPSLFDTIAIVFVC